jgi:hypothetical protein
MIESGVAMQVYRLVLTVLGALLGVGAERIFAQSAAPSEQALPETIGFLRDLIRINTTNPPGNESASAKYLQQVFDREHISCRLIEAAPGRASTEERNCDQYRIRVQG